MPCYMGFMSKKCHRLKNFFLMSLGFINMSKSHVMHKEALHEPM